MASLRQYTYPGIGEWACKEMSYCQAVRVQDKIVCSGQGGWDRTTGEISIDLAAEVEQAFENVEANLHQSSVLSSGNRVIAHVPSQIENVDQFRRVRGGRSVDLLYLHGIEEEGNFEVPGTLLGISSGQGYRVHKTAVAAACNSSVAHIFYSSLAFGGDLSDTGAANIMRTHLLTEQYITIPHSGDGPGIAWAKIDDLGEAPAKMIVSYVQDSGRFPWLNKVVLLSGLQVLSLRETVGILGRVTGKDVKIKEISAGEHAELPFKEEYWYRGVNLLKEYTSCWEAFRRGEAAVVSPLLGEILGREPEEFETTVRGLLA